MLASSLKLPRSPLKLLIPVILHILPACSNGTPHVEPLRSISANPLSVMRCNLSSGTHSFCTAAPSIWNGLSANVRSCVTLNIPSAFKITPLSVQLPHCLATHLSTSDSLRPWHYINLLTYLLTNSQTRTPWVGWNKK